MNTVNLEGAARTSSNFVQHYADRLYETGGLFTAYLEIKPSILAFLCTLVENENAVADLDTSLTPLRELGLFQENYFNNLVLSFGVHLNVTDAATKERLLQVIDTNVKPRQKANEFESFIAAYLFMRLQQHGAAFQQCSKFFGYVSNPRKKEPNADRLLEKNAASLKEILPSFKQIWFLRILDAGTLFYLARIKGQLLAYPDSLKKRKPESLQAYEKGFLLPLHAFLDDCIATFERKNVKIPADLSSKLDKALIGSQQWIEGTVKGDVKKFNSTV